MSEEKEDDGDGDGLDNSGAEFVLLIDALFGGGARVQPNITAEK